MFSSMIFTRPYWLLGLYNNQGSLHVYLLCISILRDSCVEDVLLSIRSAEGVSLSHTV